VSIRPVSLSLYDQGFDRFAAELGAAFERYGFAIVADHELDPALVKRANIAARDFFALPEAIKRRYHVEGGAGQRGYTPFGIETAKGAQLHDLKEFWHTGRDFRADVGGLYDALDELGKRLLRAVARHLGLADRFFDEPVRLGNSILRLLHYPPVPADSPHVRAGAHEDINVITLLLGAEEAGLELLDRDGRWLPVNPPPGAVVCNIGDMLQRLTNHRLPSTSHRVVNPAPERRRRPRYSTPFFLHFAPDYLIETLPGCVKAQQPDLYTSPITADDYLRERLRQIRLA
jgi:isopenicillin N synthase-like dioxygenase